MIEAIVTKFQSFRNRLFQIFQYRAGATMDLIDAVAAATTTGSIVQFSLSDLFRRTYSSLTDVLSSLFRTNLKRNQTTTEKQKQSLIVTQLLAENYSCDLKENELVLFAIDCTANPRIYADKLSDRTIVHAPNHIPGHKPTTVGHEYSMLVYLPNTDKEQHWAVPLSVRRVPSDQKGPDVGLAQLEEAVNLTDFKKCFVVNVSDTAYSRKNWVVRINKWSHVIHIARMRGNRKVYRLPHQNSRTRCGRPRIYGEVFLLKDPSQPESEEVATIVSQRGAVWQVTMQRWNDLIMEGSQEEPTYEHPFDLVRILVKDKRGKAVYRRPLWMIIIGKRRKEISSLQAYESYRRRYDIEHFFRFGKQRLALTSSQTCETNHEENWYWIALLAYNMLYQARELAESIRYPWERKRVTHVGKSQRPSQIQRDYRRIIREIGTPAPIPKPRGNPLGRQSGHKGKKRPRRPLIRKHIDESEFEEIKSTGDKNKRKSPKKRTATYTRIRRVWVKNTGPPK